MITVTPAELADLKARLANTRWSPGWPSFAAFALSAGR
jgi:hypothetical protein